MLENHLHLCVAIIISSMAALTLSVPLSLPLVNKAVCPVVNCCIFEASVAISIEPDQTAPLEQFDLVPN